MTDKIYNKLVQIMIKSVAHTVGPVAVMLANQVEGLTASPYKVTMDGDPVKIINILLEKYTRIIGPAAITLAKKGARSILKKNPKIIIPKELR